MRGTADGVPRNGLAVTGQRLDSETLDNIVQRIVEGAQPERIILFGSAARGDMGPHSHVDVLSATRFTELL